MTYKIVCRDLSGEDCDHVTEADTKEEAKRLFYEHGTSDPKHKDAYKSASREEADAFGKKIDEYLAKQDKKNYGR